MSVDEFDKFRRIFSADSFYGKRVAKHEYPCRDKLRPMWKKFCDDVHVHHLLIQLDIIARMINRRAVRSGMSLIDSTGPDEPQPQTQMWHRDKSPESDRNPSLQNEYGHCFSFVVSIGLGTQSLNYLTGDTEKEAFQLLLPPGTVVALGPEQLHAGSSCRGVRLHITMCAVWTGSKFPKTTGRWKTVGLIGVQTVSFRGWTGKCTPCLSPS